LCSEKDPLSMSEPLCSEKDPLSMSEPLKRKVSFAKNICIEGSTVSTDERAEAELEYSFEKLRDNPKEYMNVLDLSTIWEEPSQEMNSTILGHNIRTDYVYVPPDEWFSQALGSKHDDSGSTTNEFSKNIQKQSVRNNDQIQTLTTTQNMESSCTTVTKSKFQGVKSKLSACINNTCGSPRRSNRVKERKLLKIQKDKSLESNTIIEKNKTRRAQKSTVNSKKPSMVKITAKRSITRDGNASHKKVSAKNDKPHSNQPQEILKPKKTAEKYEVKTIKRSITPRHSKRLENKESGANKMWSINVQPCGPAINTRNSNKSQMFVPDKFRVSFELSLQQNMKDIKIIDKKSNCAVNNKSSKIKDLTKRKRIVKSYENLPEKSIQIQSPRRTKRIRKPVQRYKCL